MAESEEKANCEMLAKYPQMSDMPPFTKSTDPPWWRNLPVEIRREIIKSKVTPELLEQHGLSLLNAQIRDMFVSYKVMVREVKNGSLSSRISTEHCIPKWWQKLQDEIKVSILNKGHGWHDLSPHEVSAIRAASKLYWVPQKLNAWLAKAPQLHQVRVENRSFASLELTNHNVRIDM